MPTFASTSFDAYTRLLAQPDPKDLPRRAHVCRYEGDPNRRDTRLFGIVSVWRQRRNLELEVEEEDAFADRGEARRDVDGRRCFTDAANTGEHIPLRDPPRGKRVPQRRHHCRLADQIIDNLAKYTAALTPIQMIKVGDPWPPAMPNKNFPPNSFFYYQPDGNFYQVNAAGTGWAINNNPKATLMSFYYIGAINAQSITGLILAAQINTITAGQITGSIQASQIGGINASVIAGPIQSAQPPMGATILIPALIVVVVGGLGSLKGSLAGSLIIGQAETFGKAWLPGASMLMIYVVMAAVVVLRPQGLFGRALR
jgi:hypothetical protein